MSRSVGQQRQSRRPAAPDRRPSPARRRRSGRPVRLRCAELAHRVRRIVHARRAVLDPRPSRCRSPPAARVRPAPSARAVDVVGRAAASSNSFGDVLDPLEQRPPAASNVRRLPRTPAAPRRAAARSSGVSVQRSAGDRADFVVPKPALLEQVRSRSTQELAELRAHASAAAVSAARTPATAWSISALRIGAALDAGQLPAGRPGS